MIIVPSNIAQDGPGIDLTDQPGGIAIMMQDPNPDLAYARNAVTVTYDLTPFEHLRLKFKALEFGDEPHAPPPNPFPDSANFDGVAVSVNGTQWYEIQSLRSLRSDKWTTFDLDMDAIVAGLGLTFTNAFKVRFCQYDNMPAPMDGISLGAIRLEGDGKPPVLHMTMDDNAATAVVVDSSLSAQNQTFVDPAGNPNTSTHTAAGKVGTALSFDAVDDRIHLTPASHAAFLGAGADFSIAFWWKTNSPNPAVTPHILSNFSATESSMFMFSNAGNVILTLKYMNPGARNVTQTWAGGADGQWHHYAIVRKGTVLTIYRDGIVAATNTHADNSLSLAPAGVNLTIGSAPTGGQPAPGFADDFRLYNRALFASEVTALAAG
jgi:hypothetical protein